MWIIRNLNSKVLCRIFDTNFMRTIRIIGHFLGFFEGASRFFDPKIAPYWAQDNLGVKKVLAPSKNPSKWRNMFFANKWFQVIWSKLFLFRSMILQKDKVHGRMPQYIAKSVHTVHCKKELAVFPSPAGMSLIKLFLGGNNLVFSRPERVRSVTSRLGTGKWLTLFYSVQTKIHECEIPPAWQQLHPWLSVLNSRVRFPCTTRLKG
jgi:hypothetical protein